MDIESKAQNMQKRIVPPDDYRAALKAKFLKIKASRPHFSIGVLARKVGCSDSFIKKLFAGKVHLGFIYVEEFSAVLELTQQEEEFLFLHVIYHSVGGARLRQFVDRLIIERQESVQWIRESTESIEFAESK